MVGYPVNMDNTPSEAARDVDAFLSLLKKNFPGVPVETEDERFTSVLAHRAMIDGGMKQKDRRDKASVDRISAAIILQSYMDRNSAGTVPDLAPTDIPDTLMSKSGRKGRRK